ncbi:MAG TPA: Fur family transcriptional regulator [Patescibacteria group bacterium]|nr:Fur family transcriptional regulator [Patescibacteria group bacterium]
MKNKRRGRHASSSLEALDSILRSRGERATRQRRAVFAALADRADHPTAEAIHRVTRRRIPGLSLATVYTSLEVLVNAGLAGRLSGPDGVAHYDARTDGHDHRRCLGCGRIEDLDRTPQRTLALETCHAPGFRAVDCRIEIVGYCAACDEARGARTRTPVAESSRTGPTQEDHHEPS